MFKSGAVIVGSCLAALIIVACMADDDDEQFTDVNADSQEICVQEIPGSDEVERVADSNCDGGSSSHRYMYIPGSYTVPANGSRLKTNVGSFAKPTTGTIARPPSSGGFGTYRAPVGG